MSDHNTPGMPKRRLALLVAVAVLVVGVVVAVVVGTRANEGNGPLIASGSPSGTSTPAVTSPGPTGPVSSRPTESTSPTSTSSAGSAVPSARPTTRVPSTSVAAPTATGSPTVVPTSPVATTRAPLKTKAQLGNGVAVQVTRLESVKGVAQGPGEIAGPAIRVSVTVDNQTTKSVSMALALVNVYYGKDKTPAQVLSGPGANPLSKPIAAGRKSTGQYVFGVPESQRKTVIVEFSYTTSAPTVIFTGSA